MVKPRGALYNHNSPHGDVFDAYYVFESLSPVDLIGRGGDLVSVDSPGDGGTIDTNVSGTEYGVACTAGVNATNADSTKFTSATANGVDGFWHDSFTHCTLYAEFTYEAVVGGPQILFEIGGGYNGLALMCRTTPESLVLIHANEGIFNEVSSGTGSLTASPQRVRVLATCSPTALTLYMKYGDGKAAFATLRAMDASVGSHGDAPGFLGQAVGHSSESLDPEGWQGDLYALGVSTTYAMGVEQAVAYLEDPYQVLKPRRSYWLMSTASAHFIASMTSASLAISAQDTTVEAASESVLGDASFGLLARPLDVTAKVNLGLSAAGLASLSNPINTSANAVFDLLSASILLSGLDANVASESKADLESGSLSLSAQAFSTIANCDIELVSSLFGFTSRDISYIAGNGLELTAALFNSSELELNIKSDYAGALSASPFAQAANDISTATDSAFDLTAAIVAFDAKDIDAATEGSLVFSVADFPSAGADLSTNFEFSIRLNTTGFDLLTNPIEAISGDITSFLTAELGMTAQAAQYSADSIIEFISGNFVTEANSITLVPTVVYVYGHLVVRLDQALIASLDSDPVVVLDENIGAELD